MIRNLSENYNLDYNSLLTKTNELEIKLENYN
jgi:hypothetical protein